MNIQLNVQGIGAVELSFTERGQGHPVIVLHGGAGPSSVLAWADLLARTRPARVITPVHPGFGGTPRPDALDRIGQIAHVYAALLDRLGLEGATVIGNSVGGWIAAELGLLQGARLGSLVLVNATGIEVPGHPVADVFSLKPEQLRRLSFHDPARFPLDPSQLTPEQRAMMAANMRVLALYGGGGEDPTLRRRLAGGALPPTMVAWGESDRVVDAEYGRAYAQAIAGAEFRLLRGSGHLPQIETPELLVETVWPFIAEHAPRRGS